MLRISQPRRELQNCASMNQSKNGGAERQKIWSDCVGDLRQNLSSTGRLRLFKDEEKRKQRLPKKNAR